MIIDLKNDIFYFGYFKIEEEVKFYNLNIH